MGKLLRLLLLAALLSLAGCGTAVGGPETELNTETALENEKRGQKPGFGVSDGRNGSGWG